MPEAVADIYPFRVPEFSEIYDLTWDDVLDCAQNGYTIKDTAAVLGVTVVNLRTALKRRPDVRSEFSNTAKAMWTAQRGYNGGVVIGKLICAHCGKEKDRTGQRQIVCFDCRKEYRQQKQNEKRSALPETKKQEIRRKNREYAKSKRIPNPEGKRYIHPWKVKSWAKVAREMSV